MTTKPCSIVIKAPEPPDTVPRELIGLLDDRDSWEGTASELLSLIGDRCDGIPRLHNRLSAELMRPYITDALDAHGIMVHRERTSEKRMLGWHRDEAEVHIASCGGCNTHPVASTPTP